MRPPLRSHGVTGATPWACGMKGTPVHTNVDMPRRPSELGGDREFRTFSGTAGGVASSYVELKGGVTVAIGPSQAAAGEAATDSIDCREFGMSALGTQALFRIRRRWLTTVGWPFLLLAAAAIAQDLTRSLEGAELAADTADSPQETKVYSLKHATGERVVSLLRSLFIVVDQENAYMRCQFDERTDSLIVAASAQHQKQIARILALVDTPGPPEGVVGGLESGWVIKGYPIKGADGAAAASVLQSLFLVVDHRAAYARFAYDPRTRLLIAIALQRRHKQIADVLELLDSPAAHVKQAAKESGTDQLIRVYPIKHIGGQQLVSKLRSQFLVVSHEEAYVRFAFDERRRSLIVIATGKLHVAIREALAILDQLPERSEIQPNTESRPQ